MDFERGQRGCDRLCRMQKMAQPICSFGLDRAAGCALVPTRNLQLFKHRNLAALFASGLRERYFRMQGLPVGYGSDDPCSDLFGRSLDIFDRWRRSRG